MGLWFHIRTRALWLFGATLFALGLALVLQLAALLVWQYTTALQTRNWPALPVALLVAEPQSRAKSMAAPFLEVLPEPRWIVKYDSRAPFSARSILAALLDQIHIGVVPALLGAAIGFAGLLMILRQKALLAAVRQQRQDRLRRISEYRRMQQDTFVPRSSMSYAERDAGPARAVPLARRVEPMLRQN